MRVKHIDELRFSCANPKEYKGHFTIQALDTDGNVLDTYEDDNLIVNTARHTMASLIAGKKAQVGITEFLLGTRGHDEINDNILVPKQVGQDGYDESREMLFSEEQKVPFWYSVSWDIDNLVDEFDNPVTFDQTQVQFLAKGQKKNQTGNEATAENGRIPVQIELNATSVIYTFEIPELYANGNDGQSVVGYTEAALKCGGVLFSIKCFPAKIKEAGTKFKIMWKIIF